MPYPKSHKFKTKMRILQSAVELFALKGFNKVSIGEVMKAAKMTHGAFYSYFESKEALYQESVLQALGQRRVTRLAKGPLSVKHLTALVSQYFNLREDGNLGPAPEALLVNELGNDNNNLNRLFDAAYDNLKKVIETRITALIKLKQLSLDPDPELVADKARVILVSLIGGAAIAKKVSAEDERRKILEATQKQVLNLLGVKSPGS